MTSLSSLCTVSQSISLLCVHEPTQSMRSRISVFCVALHIIKKVKLHLYMKNIHYERWQSRADLSALLCASEERINTQSVLRAVPQTALNVTGTKQPDKCLWSLVKSTHTSDIQNEYLCIHYIHYNELCVCF